MFHHVAIGHTMNGASAEIAPAASGWHALLRRALALFAVLVLAAGCATTSEPIQMIGATAWIVCKIFRACDRCGKR